MPGGEWLQHYDKSDDNFLAEMQFIVISDENNYKRRCGEANTTGCTEALDPDHEDDGVRKTVKEYLLSNCCCHLWEPLYFYVF